MKEMVERFLGSIWKVLSNSTYKKVVRSTENDARFSFDLSVGRNAVFHLNGKPCYFVLKKVVNDMFKKNEYEVRAIKYRFRGTDVVIEPIQRELHGFY